MGDVNPFPGLRPFEPADAPFFFGRKAQVKELLGKLRSMHFLAVLGPSGSGKSSLVKAGVLAALERGFLAESGGWDIVQLQPGSDPLNALKTAVDGRVEVTDAARKLMPPSSGLKPREGRGSLLLFVDQFEELFEAAEQGRGDDDTRAFVRWMLSAASNSPDVYVMMTMRSEYLGYCASYPGLADAINEGLYLVAQMDRTQLREAIVGPIAASDGAIAAALVDRLLNDAEAEKDALAVLQYALRKMWAARKKEEPLDLPVYTAKGELARFLEEDADQIYNKLQPEQKRIAEVIYRTITRLTDDQRRLRSRSPLKKIVARAEVDQSKVVEVVEAFRKEGFLRTSPGPLNSESEIDLPHEALARQWGTLRQWVQSEGRIRRAIEKVERRALEWKERNKSRTFLYRGDELVVEEQYLKAREKELSAEAAEFLKVSRLWRTLRFAGTVYGLGALGLLLIFSGVVVWLWRSARSEADAANRARAEASHNQQQAIDNQREAQKYYNQAYHIEAPVATLPEEPTLLPRVYVHIRDENQRDSAKKVSAALKETGEFLTPGTERVTVGPTVAEVRYFRKVDEEIAKKVLAIVQQQGLANSRIRYIPGYEESTAMRKKHLEVWYPPIT